MLQAVVVAAEECPESWSRLRPTDQLDRETKTGGVRRSDDVTDPDLRWMNLRCIRGVVYGYGFAHLFSSVLVPRYARRSNRGGVASNMSRPVFSGGSPRIATGYPTGNRDSSASAPHLRADDTDREGTARE